jgi:hypothetical protein
MRFDKFEDDGTEGTAVPDGAHVATITKAKNWTSKDGSRSALIVTFKVGAYAEFGKFLDPEVQRDHAAAMKMAAALGLRAGDGLEPDDLIGREVVVVTRQAVDKEGMPVVDELGNRRIWINGFQPANGAAANPPVERAVAPPAAGNKPVAKRTPKQKADAAASGGTDDDIPF